MRFHETLEDILGSKIKIRILRLFYRTKGSYTGRDIAKLIASSPEAARRALNDLVSNGLLKLDYVGTSHSYYLNEDHMLVDKVVNKAFFAEQNAIREIVRIFKEQLGDEFQEAVVFGSVAKKKERPDSDVDMLVVVRDGIDMDSIEDRVNKATNLATAASGNPVMPIVIQSGEYEKKRKAKNKQGIWSEIFDRSKSITYTREDIESYGEENQ